jgi:hypothetical protein
MQMGAWERELRWMRVLGFRVLDASVGEDGWFENR